MKYKTEVKKRLTRLNKKKNDRLQAIAQSQRNGISKYFKEYDPKWYYK